MTNKTSNVIVHKLNFSSELERIIPHMKTQGETKWATYHPRSTYGYVDAIDHAGSTPEVNRYVVTTEGVGSKTPIDKQHKLEVPWFGQNGLFEAEPPWTFAKIPSIKTTYGIDLEDLEVGTMTLDQFIWNQSNFEKWEAFFSTKEVIGTA